MATWRISTDVPLGGDRKLANPQASLSYNCVGADPHTVPIRGHPEMVELYWAAHLRDVPFSEYDSNGDTGDAYDELTNLDGCNGPDNGSPGNTLFRDAMPGCDLGPLQSQFWLVSADYGRISRDLRIRGHNEGEAFMTDYDQWLAVQKRRTDVIEEQGRQDDRRWIATGRDLGTFVHGNLPAHDFLHAAVALDGGAYNGVAVLKLVR